MPVSRRNLLSLLGLASVATGIPLSVLASFRANGRLPEAWAAPAPTGSPQFLILSTGGAGEPLNTNAPGAYGGIPGVFNNPHPELAPTPLKLGPVATVAGRAWSTLPDTLLARASFIHHRTYQNAHPQYPKVLALLGKAKSAQGFDQLPSVLAAELAPLLGTIQVEPIPLSGNSDLSFQGRPLQSMSPLQLKATFAQKTGDQLKLEQLRNKTLDGMFKRLKADGTRAQLAWLDRHATSVDQVRKLDSTVLGALSTITTDGPADQLRAAVILIQMKLAPVLAVHIPFGGDTHNDADFTLERDQTLAAMDLFNLMMELLSSAGLSDEVTFANLDVFGRTLTKRDGRGRDHNLNHHTMLIVGKNVRPSVIGGIAAVGNDFGATGIDSKTGASSDVADVPATETLEAASKTLGKALGIASDVMDQRILAGKEIIAALQA